jgi:hypothetical protein
MTARLPVPLAFAVALWVAPASAQDAPSAVLGEPIAIEPAPAAEPAPVARVPRGAAPTPDAGGTGGSRGGMGGGGPPGYSAAWYPSRGLRDQRADLGFVRQSLNLGVPVWRAGGDTLILTASVRNTALDTDAVLPETGRAFPDPLWSVSVGATYMHRFENGWSGGVMLGVGSASDKPFDSIREMTANLGGFLRVPVKDGRDSWQFSLFYMAGGAVNFPLPGVAYNWNPSERFRMSIGLPLSVFWQPTDDLTFTASYVPLFNINARIAYRVAPAVRAFAAYEFVNESYFLAGRADRQDRFFVFEQRLVSGLQWEPRKAVRVEVNGGYSFGRRYGEGQSQFGSLRDEVNVRPGPFLGAHLGLRF